VRVTVDVPTGVFDQFVGEKVRAAREAAADVLLEAGDGIAEAAGRGARRRTGALAESFAPVYADADKVVVASSSRYAVFQEFGTARTVPVPNPTLTRALQEWGPKALRSWAEALRD
jgi:hypothetical protein